MDNNLQKYYLTQDGREFILSSDIKNNLVILSCIETNKENPPIFVGEFSLSHLRQLNKLFDSKLTVKDAQDLINKTIEAEKLKIEYKEKQINIYLYLLNQTTLFILHPNIGSPKVEITYSPKKYLPVRKIFYPPVYIKRPTIYIDELDSNNNINQQNNSNISSTKRNENLSLTLTPRKRQKNIPGSNILFTSSFNNNLRNIPQNGIDLRVNKIEKYENKKIIELQNEINQIKMEYNLEKDKTSKLNEELEKLNHQISIRKLLKENYKETLNREKEYFMKNNEISKENSEIIILREQNEKLSVKLKEINENFEKYKIEKEEELKKLISTIYILENEKNELILEKKKLSKQFNMLQFQYENVSQKYNNYFNQAIIVKGEIIEKNNERDFLTKKIFPDENLKISFNLLYKASIDSDKAEAFHKKCDNSESSIVLIKSKNGKRFGGFTSCSWKGNYINKKDEKAFVFSLDKMEIYDIISGKDAIGCYPNNGPVFLGCQIRIYDNAFEKGGTTVEKGMNYKTNEDFELTGGLQAFQIEEIEVYEIKLE
jgi:hypothetical protein